MCVIEFASKELIWVDQILFWGRGIQLILTLTTTVLTPRVAFGATDGTRMIDLCSLGGHSGIQFGMKNRRQVVGISNTNGDASTHPFLWSAERLVRA